MKRVKRDEFVGKHIQKKGRNAELPEDIIINILSRVPASRLLTFKFVSPLWRRLISSQYFLQLHLRQWRENSIYILHPSMDIIRSLYLMHADGVIISRIYIPPGFGPLSLSVICSYHGLICFTNYSWFPHCYKTRYMPLGELVMDDEVVIDLEIGICNPATREGFLLPNGSLRKRELGIGVSFGPGISEYRVFRFFCSKSESEDIHPECEIFSSSTRTWRSIGFVQHAPTGAHHVFVNGKVFWFISSSDEENEFNIPGSILSADLEENFNVISLPAEVNVHSFLVDLNGCLSLVAFFDDDGDMVIWTLKDENESEWKAICQVHIYHDPAESLVSLTAIRNDIFLITESPSYFGSEAHYYIFNISTESWNELDLEEGRVIAFPYTETLLPCNGQEREREA